MVDAVYYVDSTIIVLAAQSVGKCATPRTFEVTRGGEMHVGSLPA